MRSLADVSKAHGDVGPGFDTLRIALSIGVVATHSVSISYGTAVSDRILHMPVASPISAILPLFFALSGYLVMGSALRTATLRQFLLLRVLRIVPALATEIMLSALFIGLLFSSVSLGAYLADDRLHAYFGSLFGRISLYLPGVFVENPLPDIVNGSLWTINPEIFCYVFLGLCLSTRIHRHRGLMLASFLALLALCLVLDYRRNTDLFNVFSYIHVLILAFSAGNVLYLWRDKVPYSPALFAVSLVAGLTLIREPYFVYVAVCGLTYCVVYLGFQPLYKPAILKTGDYSYGIYLYGFPIQQAVSNLMPWSREWYLNLLISLPFICAVAAVSWHFIEKPALKLRKSIAPAASAPTADEPEPLWKSAAVISGLLVYAVLLSRWSGINSFDITLVNLAKYALAIAILTTGGLVISRLKFLPAPRAARV